MGYEPRVLRLRHTCAIGCTKKTAENALYDKKLQRLIRDLQFCLFLKKWTLNGAECLVTVFVL